MSPRLRMPAAPGRAPWLAAVLLAALAARVAWVLVTWWRRGAELEFSDEALFWQLASNLVAHGSLVTDDGRFAARPPLYPLLLALPALAGAAGVLLARLLQALLGALTVLVAYHFGRGLAGRRAGLAAAALIALDPFAVFFAGLLLSETLFSLLLLAFTWSAWRVAADRAGSRLAALAGVAMLSPMLVLTRPEALLLVGAAWLLLVALARRRQAALASVACAVVAMIVLLTPWALRNRTVLGQAVWLSTNGGVTLYDALGPQADGSSDQAFLEDMPQLAGLSEVQRDAWLADAARRAAREEPLRVLRLAGVKLARTWNPFPNVDSYRGGATAWAGAAYTVLVIAGAVIGAGRLARLRRGRAGAPRVRSGRSALALLLAPVLLTTLLSCVFIGSVRYRVPLMPPLAVLACAALAGRRGAGS